jgi:dienelactone hydrolase
VIEPETVTDPETVSALDAVSDLDPMAWTMQRYETAPLRMTFRATNRADALLWQQQLRAKVTELIGGFPDEREPLAPVKLEVREFPGYVREKVKFVSRPGVSVLAYVLRPKDITGPLASVVCVPGHGRGVDAIVGIGTDGEDHSGEPEYEAEFALQAVERGLAVVAIEPMAFGHRRDPAARQRGDESQCEPVAGAALLLGETMIGWRVWDVMRTLDYIETRPDLDARRVGCVGISGGGTCALFTAALDERIRCTYLSGYLNTFRASIMSVPHCIDNYIPGILNWAEMYDVAGLIAPRPLFSEAGDHDPIFPVAAAKESFQRVKDIYTVLGAESSVALDIFDGGHRFNGERGWPFTVAALSSQERIA